jgi:hypothetical protein
MRVERVSFPNKEEAVRFFTDVKTAISACPDVFQDAEIDIKLVDHFLDGFNGDWLPLDNLYGVPNDLYEISRDGVVRRTDTKETLEVVFDIDKNEFVVWILYGGKEWCLIAHRLAEMMFSEKALVNGG